MFVAALLMAGVLSGGEPDGVVITAPATTVDLAATVQPTASAVEGAAQAAVPHGLTTDEQIDRWIAARSPANKPFADGEARAEVADDRKMHGEMTVAVGTGDYREYGVAVSLPIGETSQLDLSYREIHNGDGRGRHGYDYGDPYDLDDGGYAFPGYQPGALAEFEWRARRPGGSPRSRPLIEPRRQTPE